MTAPIEPPHARRHIEEIVLVMLVLLSGAGVIANDYASPQTGVPDWLWMTPVFGIVSTWAAWSRAQRRGDPVGASCRRRSCTGSASSAPCC